MDTLEQHGIRAMRSLRAASGAIAAPPEIEASLLRAFSAAQAAARPPRRSWLARVTSWAAPAAGVCVMAMVGLSVLHVPQQQLLAQPGNETPFVVLASAERLADQSNLTLVETRVSSLELATWGMPVDPEAVAGTVRAQVLMAPDGEALALRLLD
ncbi:MAG TPA: hypothetical protein VIT92_10650 [Burkholderiaceae bacterium]